MSKTLSIINRNFKDLNPLHFEYEKNAPALTMHSFPYYLIYYVTKGSGVFRKNSGEFTVNEGDIFIAFPDEKFSCSPSPESPLDYIKIGFDGNFADEFHKLSSTVMPLNSGVFFEMLDVFNKTSFFEEFLISKLFILYSELFEEKKRGYVDTALKFIAGNYMNNITVLSIARHLGLNSRYFSNIFKKEMGIGLKDYLINFRLEHAKTLLKQNHSVQMTADKVGYVDCSYFSKAFFNKYGLYPTEFVKSEQNKPNLSIK